MSGKNGKRTVARLYARELSVEELDLVAGGAGSNPSSNCNGSTSPCGCTDQVQGDDTNVDGYE